MWWENNVLIAIFSLTVIAGLTIWRLPDDAKDIVIPIVTAVAAFVTGYVSRSMITSLPEEKPNAPTEPAVPKVK